MRLTVFGATGGVGRLSCEARARLPAAGGRGKETSPDRTRALGIPT